MAKIDRLIRSALAQKAKGAALEPSADCLSDAELSEYVYGISNEARRYKFEKHISDCFLCLDKIVSAHEGESRLRRRKMKTPSAKVLWKAKNVARISDSPDENRLGMFSCDTGNGPLPKTQKIIKTEEAVIKWLPKNLKKNKWLIASITAFALSFAFPPVFLQFLLAAGILGGKWIFDSQNTKLLITIYDAWKKGHEKEAGEMLKTLKDRIPSNHK